jgi:hypothetical protein
MYVIKQPGNLVNLEGLNDSQPSDTATHNLILAMFAILGYEYERTILYITEVMNSTYAPWYCRASTSLSDECYNNAQVEKIIRSYDNLVLENNLPEYNLEKISTEQVRKIEATVAYTSGQPELKCHRILNGLYYKFKKGGSQDLLLFPDTTKRNEGYRLMNDKIKSSSGLELADDAIDSALDFGGTLLNVALFAGVVVGGIYLINILKKVS